MIPRDVRAITNATDHLDKDRTCFTVSAMDLKVHVFDPVVNNVLELLDEQIKKSKDVEIAAVFMAGGFSNSKYLTKSISSYCSMKNIRFNATSDSVHAISRGAVSYYLQQNRLILRKISGLSIGLQVTSQKNDGSSNHLATFFREGALVEDQKFEMEVSVTYPVSAVLGKMQSNQIISYYIYTIDATICNFEKSNILQSKRRYFCQEA